MRFFDRKILTHIEKKVIIIRKRGINSLGNTADILKVTAILDRAKELILNNDFDFVPRRKNMQALAECGLTIMDAKEEILSLRAENYYKGPKKDFDRPGEIWEFKKLINGASFYIKFKIVLENDKVVLKCIGFHEDEFV